MPGHRDGVPPTSSFRGLLQSGGPAPSEAGPSTEKSLLWGKWAHHQTARLPPHQGQKNAADGLSGVATGVGDGIFDPNGQLAREQAAILPRPSTVPGDLRLSAPHLCGDDSVSGWAKAAVGRIQQSGVMMDTGDNMFPPLQKNRPTPESSPSPPSYDCTVWPLLFPNDSPAQSPLSMGRAKILPVSPIGSRRRTGPFSPDGTALTNPWK